MRSYAWFSGYQLSDVAYLYLLHYIIPYTSYMLFCMVKFHYFYPAQKNCIKPGFDQVLSRSATKESLKLGRRPARAVSTCRCGSTVWVKKIPPEDLWQFFQNRYEFFNQILHAYYAFLSTLDYEFLFSYLQLWRSYAILSATHPVHIMCAICPVHHQPKRIFWHFSQTVRNF